ncbi:MAG: M23 family metallopeptidase [Pseudomonadota bacterium]
MKNKKLFYSLFVIPVLIILVLFAWFVANIFEGHKPDINLEPLPEFLAKSASFKLKIGDMQRGLRGLKVTVNQEGREITVLEKKFPFNGFLNRQGIRQHTEDLVIDPSALHLAQGRVDLKIHVWDYSRRGGGDGNLSLLAHKMIVDTIPPAIRALSRMHNINVGGSGLVVYQTSSDAQESGVFVDDRFFPGYPSEMTDGKGLYVCYFGIAHDAGPKPAIALWAKDRAGNSTKSSFYTHVRKTQFRKEKINLSERFLQRVLPYFSFYGLDPQSSEIDRYLKINRDLRVENNRTFLKMVEKTSPRKLWDGPWLRLKNAASMAGFGARRSYNYKGEKVDEQDHLGIDLASLANSPVQAANSGRVLFADRNGIYGMTVVLDHGQGLFSVYGHLSKIEAPLDKDVSKGELIAYTGETGLAGGDHLHFGVMVNGLFVNPIEWWDSHWIEDNITRKLALLK